MTEVEVELFEPDPEYEAVIRFRIDSLLRAGMPEFEAKVLGRADWVDWHVAVRLFKAGCPPEDVCEILM